MKSIIKRKPDPERASDVAVQGSASSRKLIPHAQHAILSSCLQYGDRRDSEYAKFEQALEPKAVLAVASFVNGLPEPSPREHCLKFPADARKGTIADINYAITYLNRDTSRRMKCPELSECLLRIALIREGQGDRISADRLLGLATRLSS